MIALDAVAISHVARLAERVQLVAQPIRVQVVPICTLQTDNPLSLHAVRVSIGIRTLLSNQTLAQGESIPRETTSTGTFCRCIGLALRIKTHTSCLSRQVVTGVAFSADSVSVGAFTVGVSVARVTVAFNTGSSCEHIAGVAAETGSIGGAAGLAQGVELGALLGARVKVVPTGAFGAGSPFVLLAVDIHVVIGASGDTLTGLEDIAWEAAEAGASRVISSVAQRVDLSAFAICPQEEAS